MILTYRYRVKSLNGHLNRQARAVNFVWNYCNETQRHAAAWGRKWLTGFDLNNLTAGASKELGLSAATINAVCEQYAKSRFGSRRRMLRWRGKRSLGWIPVKAISIRREGNAFRFYGKTYRVFNPRQLPEGAKIKDGGGFSQDGLGRWYLNVVVEMPDAGAQAIINAIGVDLGLTHLASMSNGEKIENPRHLRLIADRLGRAQRARKKRQAARLHAKAANARRDHLHKLSTRLVRQFDYIAVGDVNAAGLAKSRMAKSVNDAAWTSFRNMLRYKAIARGAIYVEVDESFSSQVCSSCGTLPDSRPRGIADLGIRAWTCSDCGAVHDRDVNAAMNILRSGRRAPVEGIGATY